MFDVGFSELVVIGVIALIVIGPEDLPRVARTVGHLLGRMRAYAADVKAEVTREMDLAEMRRLHADVKHAVQDIQHSVVQEVNGLKEGLHEFEASLAREQAPAELPPAAASEPAQAQLPEPASLVEAEGEGEKSGKNQPDLFAAPAAEAKAETQVKDKA